MGFWVTTFVDSFCQPHGRRVRKTISVIRTSILLLFLVRVLNKVDVWRWASFKASLRLWDMWYHEKSSSWKLRKLTSSPASFCKVPAFSESVFSTTQLYFGPDGFKYPFLFWNCSLTFLCKELIERADWKSCRSHYEKKKKVKLWIGAI